MTRVRPLDEAVLVRFDRALSDYAPAVRRLLVHPGLRAEGIEEHFAATGLRPSREALAWWGYFDAVSVDPSELEILPVFRFLTPAQSVDLYRWQRRRAGRHSRQCLGPALDAGLFDQYRR